MGIKKTLYAHAAMLFAIFFAAGCATYKAPGITVSQLPAGTQAAPEGGYTWQQLASLVIASSPDYAAILSDARTEYYRYKARTDLNDLQLSLEYSYLPDERIQSQYGIGIRFSIPNPFVDKQIVRTGEAARREIETGTEVLKYEIASMIYKLVHEILIGERKLDVLLSREQFMSEWADYMQMRYAARMATQADILSFDIQRLRLKTDVQEARADLQAARKSLEVLVQIPPGQMVLNPFPSDWKALPEFLDDEQGLIEDAFSRSAELAGANAAYEKACAIYDTARARQIPWFNSIRLSYAPRISEVINYNSSGALMPPTQKQSNEWMVGLNIDLPVFAWFSSEKKMAASGIETASLQVAGIQQRIRSDITVIVADLRNTLSILDDYQSAFDSIPEPTRETIPDTESYYKLMDARFSISEYSLKTELQCANIYSKLIKITGGWEQD